ncbi:hypothetical protein [Bacillus sp. X1(2014)]|uniref:hypothetical protein n=1 Tax=Bacillus sp. X1(2014) TaxID=1565991 RepID=UPI0011A6C730|nr:hypothetical protein [Bacillus sp. X1(2014)]
MLKLITYEGKRPDASQIRTKLIEKREFHYIVATKALEQERANEQLLPAHQSPQNESKPIAVFHQLLREWVGGAAMIASRGEEKTMIRRSIQKVADTDEVLKNVLRQDVSSWVKALADLAAVGHDLTKTIPTHLENQLVNPFVGQLLQQLQQEYDREFFLNDKCLFEKEARSRIRNLVEYVKPLVIMEGFTFLTPLQKYFVEVCDKFGREVVFIVPYHHEQSQGYERIETTYFKDLLISTRSHWKNEPVSKKEDLHYLQQNLFGKPFQVKDCTDQSVELINFPTRDREILSFIETLKTWFDGRYKPNEVVIVVRRLHEFKEKLQDFLHSSGLTYLDDNGNSILVKIKTSPRLLLLTPVGRFILTLYDSWKDNQICIQNEQFETVLSSGWLGASIQDSTISFRAIKHQFFLHCESKLDWMKAFNDLENAINEDQTTLSSRMPIHSVTSENIEHWRKTINILEEICSRLFQAKKGGIAKHIRVLQDELKRLEVENIRQYEQDVLVKIQEVFEELKSLYALDITPSEFGEALHALVNQQPDDQDEDGTNEPVPGENLLWITTPEGIDGMERKAILYLGVDNQHVPAKLPMNWPFFTDEREEHLQKERYMFLTVVRAATEHLIMTSSRNDGDKVLKPSAYMSEIARLLNRKITTPTTKDLIDASLAPEFVPSFHRTPHRRKKFLLTDLVQYGLCPLRYSLEIRHPEAKQYRNDWQLEVFAQGVWMNKTFEALARYYDANRKTKGVEAVYQLFCRAMTHVESEVKKLFLSFDDVIWHGIRQQVEKQMKYYAVNSKDYPVHFEKGQKKTFDLLMDENSQHLVKIEIVFPYFMVSGIIHKPLLDSISTSEWLLPGKKVEQNEEEERNAEEEEWLFSSLYEARQWWSKTADGVLAEGKQNRNSFEESRYQHYLQAKERIKHWIEDIWNNKFPANIGDHCKVCPVRTECLGVEMEGTYY